MFLFLLKKKIPYIKSSHVGCVVRLRLEASLSLFSSVKTAELPGCSAVCAPSQNLIRFSFFLPAQTFQMCFENPTVCVCSFSSATALQPSSEVFPPAPHGRRRRDGIKLRSDADSCQRKSIDCCFALCGVSSFSTGSGGFVTHLLEVKH